MRLFQHIIMRCAHPHRDGFQTQGQYTTKNCDLPYQMPVATIKTLLMTHRLAGVPWSMNSPPRPQRACRRCLTFPPKSCLLPRLFWHRFLAGTGRWESRLRAGGTASFCFIRPLTDTLGLCGSPKKQIEERSFLAPPQKGSPWRWRAGPTRPFRAPRAGSHGQRFSDRGFFSCVIPQWQAHVINLDGARPHRCLVQSKIVVTRRPPEEPTLRTALTVAPLGGVERR